MVEYDVLGNERHKAICKLREMPKLYPNKDGGADLYAWKSALADAIGADTELFSAIRNRLIHLLGGDQPTLGDILREDDDGVDAGGRDEDGSGDTSAPSPQCDCGSRCGGLAEEVAPITTELRNRAERYCNFKDNNIVKFREEEFDCLCDNIDAIHAGLEREVKKAWSEAKTQRNNFNQATSAREHWKKLYEQALEHIHDLEHDVEMWRDRAEDMRMERDDALRGQHGYPDIRDADNVPICIGDVMDFTKNVRGLTVLGVGIVDASESSYGVFVREGSDYVWYNAEFLHHHVPTVEGLIRDAVLRCVGHLPEYWDEPIAECAAKLKLADA